jgi:hypothetical protein
MARNIQTIDHYKEILRQAIELNDKLSIKAKEKIIGFKNKLKEYIGLVDSFTARPAESTGDEAIWEEDAAVMKSLQIDLDRIGGEIIEEVTAIKSAFQ